MKIKNRLKSLILWNSQKYRLIWYYKYCEIYINYV